MSYTLLFYMGGAVRDHADQDAAFSGGEAEHAININGMWTPGQEPSTGSGRALSGEEMSPHSTGGVYVNFLGEEGQERVRGRVRPREVRAAGGPEGEVRPGERLPHKPERRTCF